MPTLRELKKRLESAETIKQLSGAMRSAATAKYAKLAGALAAYSPYAEALRSVAPASRGVSASREDGARKDGVGAPSANALGASPTLLLLISGNRGLCGGYHQQLFAHFSEFAQLENVRVAAAGKRALDFCRAKKIPVEESFDISDVPTFAEAKEIAGYAYGRYRSGDVSAVAVCCQRFYNMLRSDPETRVILRRDPPHGASDGDDIIFIPDEATIKKELVPLIFTADVYDMLLSAATGAQAATLVAMRSAYDNACSSISSLEISINRLRQAAVTAGVLETATDAKE